MTDEDFKIGTIATCELCDKEIRYIGSHWEHTFWTDRDRHNTTPNYPYLIQELESIEPPLTGRQIAEVLKVVFNTCGHCLDNEKPCYCWDDS